MKNKRKSIELAEKFLDGDKAVSLKDIDRENEKELFSNDLERYSFNNKLIKFGIYPFLSLIYFFRKQRFL